MIFPTPLFAVLAARRAHDSAADAGRIALVSMLIKPPILGLILAIVMARRAAQVALATNDSDSDTKPSHGKLIIDQVAPETDLHSFLPSFVGFTRKQAQEFAKELRLTPQFLEDQSSDTPLSKQRVVNQEPAPGAGWPKDRNVTLTLG
jgi:hypothetical protein